MKMQTSSKSALVALVMLATVLQSSAASRYRVSSEHIRTFLQLKGVDVALQIPEVESRVLSPSLRVVSRHQHQQTVYLRIRCLDARECLPFYATLCFASTEEAAAFRAILPHKSAAKEQNTILVARGSLARMEIDLPRVRGYVIVRVSESGSEGDSIHVRDEQTGRIYLARVLNTGHLRAKL